MEAERNEYYNRVANAEKELSELKSEEENQKKKENKAKTRKLLPISLLFAIFFFGFVFSLILFLYEKLIFETVADDSSSNLYKLALENLNAVKIPFIITTITSACLAVLLVILEIILKRKIQVKLEPIQKKQRNKEIDVKNKKKELYEFNESIARFRNTIDLQMKPYYLKIEDIDKKIDDFEDKTGFIKC